MFSTRDPSRKIVYSVNPADLNGTEIRYVQQIAAASFGTVVPAKSCPSTRRLPSSQAPGCCPGASRMSAFA
ncbi:hypothetical protein ACFWBB_20375 [Streptomyces sp. NPDC060000]|uniref:hypothetical protein n=1 Tax=Streptomyces sp. NPDC060000 TaxID=3347031 RepID=UPI0036799BDF